MFSSINSEIVITQPIQTVEPQLPAPTLPQVPVDPTNPLSWVVVLTLLLGTTEKPISAMAKLIQAISVLILASARIKSQK